MKHKLVKAKQNAKKLKIEHLVHSLFTLNFDLQAYAENLNVEDLVYSWPKDNRE